MAYALCPGFLRRCVACALLLFAALGSQAQPADKRNLAVGAASPAFSEKRVALVIGNSAYANAPLRNPLNDAADMAASCAAWALRWWSAATSARGRSAAPCANSAPA